MKATPIIDKRVREGLDSLPTVGQFAEYLVKTGWIKVKQNNRKIFVFGTTEPSYDGSESPILIFPAKDSYSDAKLRIEDTINTLSNYRGKSFHDMLMEVFCYGTDVLRQRIIMPAIRGIPLKMMPELLRDYRKLIEKTAQLEVSPQGERPYQLGKASQTKQKSQEIIENCLFGHTFVGSFGISIEMPLKVDASQISGISRYRATLERLTMQRVAIGLSDANRVLKGEPISTITDNVENGFNIDICQSMESLMTTLSLINGTPSIDYTFNWSPLIVPCKEIATLKTLAFAPREVLSVFQDATKEMKKLHQTPPITIRGEILTLADDPEKKDTNEKWRRTITLRCKSKPGINIVTITLSSEEDYAAACIIRGHGQWLSVRGILNDDGKGHRLLSPQKLKEVPPLFIDEA